MSYIHVVLYKRTSPIHNNFKKYSFISVLMLIIGNSGDLSLMVNIAHLLKNARLLYYNYISILIDLVVVNSNSTYLNYMHTKIQTQGLFPGFEICISFYFCTNGCRRAAFKKKNSS